MTPSTTNTAAREVLAVMREAQKEYAGHHSSGTFRRLADKLEATLTQQQGGEQEAVVTDEMVERAVDASDAYWVAPENQAPCPQCEGSGAVAVGTDGDRDYCDCQFGTTTTGTEHGAMRAALTAALSKQPAASEGDGPVAYADPVAFRNFKERGHLGGVHAREWMWANPGAGLVPIYTSKQAAGEAVVGEKFVRGWIDLPALPGGMMMGNKGRFGPIPGTAGCVITTSETTLAEWKARGTKFCEVFTTPPRHPADEGAVCAEDLRWLDDIAADLKQAGGSTNNMRLIALNRAIAALQAGTP